MTENNSSADKDIDKNKNTDTSEKLNDKEQEKNQDDQTDNQAESTDTTEENTSDDVESDADSSSTNEDGSDSEEDQSTEQQDNSFTDGFPNSTNVEEGTPETEAAKELELYESQKALNIAISLESIANYMDTRPVLKPIEHYLIYQNIRTTLSGTGMKPSKVFPGLESYEQDGQFKLDSSDLKSKVGEIRKIYSGH